MVDEVPSYPGYDVLKKRDGLSWNDATRRTLDARLEPSPGPRFFTPFEWRTLRALCERIVPQAGDRETVPLPDMLDLRLLSGRTDGFRRAGLPPQDVAWRRGLAALSFEARSRHGCDFQDIAIEKQNALLRALQSGDLAGEAWKGMSGKAFFEHRLLPDISSAYYSHPFAWNEIGFGGPASPRGYVRMEFDRRDPWEATEAKPRREREARKDNGNVR